MEETGWMAIGRVAKARRERLGLKQDELANYGGPRVATVGKFERGAQASFPPRTQQQIERALGWPLGTIEDFVSAVDESVIETGEWEHELVSTNVPDLTERQGALSAAEMPRTPWDSVMFLIGRLHPSLKEEAYLAAFRAVLPFVDESERLLREGEIADAEQAQLDAEAERTERAYHAYLDRLSPEELRAELGDDQRRLGKAPDLGDNQHEIELEPLPVAAHEEEETIESTQGHDETP